MFEDIEGLEVSPAGWVLPALLLGIWAGITLVRTICQEQFRETIMGLTAFWSYADLFMEFVVSTIFFPHFFQECLRRL